MQDVVDVMEMMGIDVFNPTLIEELAANAVAKGGRVGIPSKKAIDLWCRSMKKNVVLKHDLFEGFTPSEETVKTAVEAKRKTQETILVLNDIDIQILEEGLALHKRGVLDLMDNDDRYDLDDLMGTSVFSPADIEKQLIKQRAMNLETEVRYFQEKPKTVWHPSLISSYNCENEALCWLEEKLEEKHKLFMEELRNTTKSFKEALYWIEKEVDFFVTFEATKMKESGYEIKEIDYRGEMVDLIRYLLSL